MTLTPEEKVQLADQLVASIGETADQVLHSNWAEEAKRRRDEVRVGDVTPIPKGEAMARVRRAI